MPLASPYRSLLHAVVVVVVWFQLSYTVFAATGRLCLLTRYVVSLLQLLAIVAAALDLGAFHFVRSDGFGRGP